MKVAFIFGTRPEAVKMFPIIREVERHEGMECCNIITAQHREMLDPFLKLFNIRVDYDLDIFESGQSLTQITVRALRSHYAAGYEECYYRPKYYIDMQKRHYHHEAAEDTHSATMSRYLPFGIDDSYGGECKEGKCKKRYIQIHSEQQIYRVQPYDSRV